MNRSLLAIFAFVTFSQSANAQPDPPPTTMIEFLKPGMFVGLTFEDDLQSLIVTVLENDTYEVLQDASELAFDELLEKYPAIKNRRDESLKKFVAKKKETADVNMNDIMGRIFSAIEPTLSELEMHGEILAIGEDYVHVSSNDGRKYTLPTSGLKFIVWLGHVDVATYIREEPLNGGGRFVPGPNVIINGR